MLRKLTEIVTHRKFANFAGSSLGRLRQLSTFAAVHDDQDYDEDRIDENEDRCPDGEPLYDRRRRTGTGNEGGSHRPRRCQTSGIEITHDTG